MGCITFPNKSKVFSVSIAAVTLLSVTTKPSTLFCIVLYCIGHWYIIKIINNHNESRLISDKCAIQQQYETFGCDSATSWVVRTYANYFFYLSSKKYSLIVQTFSNLP